MISIKEELSEKKDEVKIMLFMIDEVAKLKGGVVNSSILKSAYILLLYNIIESTMTMIFERVHEELSMEHYDDLVPDLKVLWVEFFFVNHPQKYYKDHLDQTIEKRISFPKLEEFNNRIKLFSGNLDGKKLDGLLKKYAIGKLSTKGKEKLLVIKNKRNKIAHGEETFKVSCRNLVESDLKALNLATFNALESITQQTEKYLVEKKYLLPKKKIDAFTEVIVSDSA